MADTGVTPATRLAGAEPPAELVKLVCFVLRRQEFAAPIADVKEMILLRPITRVFLTPPWLAGLINLRGEVVAVIDLAHLLGMDVTVPTDESRIIILRHRGRSAGIVVDKMSELRHVDFGLLQPPPVTLAPDGESTIRGIATVDRGQAVRIIDVARIFESDQVRALRRGGT